MVYSLVSNKSLNNNSKRIVIVGAGSAGQEVARKILNKHMKKYNIIGFVDDDTKKYKLQVIVFYNR